ncbi:MAG: oligosaccharide flippase family protein [Brumimicrobium sp.]|nr:oligosaccharide flippase family protein [Brumimicrobium sp.]
MQKKFFGNLLLIILLNVLIKPVYLFAIDAQVQNTVGAESYGIYFTLLNFSFLFNMFLDIGITNFNTKNIAEHPHTVSKYIGPILGLKMILGLLYATFTLGAALLLDYGDLEMHLLGLLVLNQFLVGIIFYLRSNFSGLHLFGIDAFLSVLDRSLLIVVSAILLYGSVVNEPFQIEWFVYAQTGSYALSAFIALLITLIKVGRIRFSLRRTFSIALLRKSTPYALLILLMMLYTRMDAVMLERMLPDGKEQAGIYAQGFRLLDAVNMVAFLVAGFLLPIFARKIKLRESITKILKDASLLLIGMSLLVAISASFSSTELMDLIYNEEIESSAHAFSWIILSFMPMATSYAFGTLLTANGSMKVLNQMAMGGIFINLVLNAVLIPQYKAEGAAIATFVTQAATAVIQVLLTLKIFALKVRWDLLVRVGVFVALLIPGGIVCDYFNLGIERFIILMFSGTLALFVLKIIDLKSIRGIVLSAPKG